MQEEKTFVSKTTIPALNLKLEHKVFIEEEHTNFTIPVFNSCDQTLEILNVEIYNEENVIIDHLICRTKTPIRLTKNTNPYHFDFSFFQTYSVSHALNFKVSFYTNVGVFDTNIHLVFKTQYKQNKYFQSKFLPSKILIDGFVGKKLKIYHNSLEQIPTILVHRKDEPSKIVEEIKCSQENFEYHEFNIKNNLHLSKIENYIFVTNKVSEQVHKKISFQTIEPNSGYSEFGFFKGWIYSQVKDNQISRGRVLIKPTKKLTCGIRLSSNVDYIQFFIDEFDLSQSEEYCIDFLIHSKIFEEYDFDTEPLLILEESNGVFQESIPIPIEYYFSRIIPLRISAKIESILVVGEPLDVLLEIETVGKGDLSLEIFCEFLKYNHKLKGINKHKKEFHKFWIQLDTSKLYNYSKLVLNIVTQNDYGDKHEFKVETSLVSNLIQIKPDKVILFEKVPIFLDNKVVYKELTRKDLLPHTISTEVIIYKYPKEKNQEVNMEHTEIRFKDKDVRNLCPVQIENQKEISNGNIKLAFKISLNSKFITDFMLTRNLEVRGCLIFRSNPENIGNTLLTSIPFFISFIIAECKAYLICNDKQWFLKIKNVSNNELYVWDINFINNYYLKFVSQPIRIIPKNEIVLQIHKKTRSLFPFAKASAPILTFKTNQFPHPEVLLEQSNVIY